MNEKKHVENEIVKKTPVTESAVEKDIGKEREYAVSANDLLGKLKGNIGVLKQRKNSSAGTAIPEEMKWGMPQARPANPPLRIKSVKSMSLILGIWLTTPLILKFQINLMSVRRMKQINPACRTA